jgi:hypothetical protein
VKLNTYLSVHLILKMERPQIINGRITAHIIVRYEV